MKTHHFITWRFAGLLHHFVKYAGLRAKVLLSTALYGAGDVAQIRRTHGSEQKFPWPPFLSL
ncbi:hypothetical protein IGI04_024550 [Brassica rapa subsp. trilocularis]|uniref:Uncharacterized protein n=1 Tax=Brassica rapa subsp. trilocularis TaxID=1813537 RepID=A0ABQ7M7N1_BRACM|nr:hypothetical protein IGI04_024203 [Brassica rapa subsp. trilocularis]KAG5394587.1 hypothetical protein IGI04_024550 [Brassica rapa subsp. trilocularis]